MDRIDMKDKFPMQMQHPTPDESSIDLIFLSFVYPSQTTAALYPDLRI